MVDVVAGPSAPPRADILIVDDEPDIVEFLSEVLRDEGYAVRTARNGRQALDSIRASEPSLLILDLMMPELDGFGVLDALRSERIGTHFPAIVLSAKSTHKDVLDALERGAYDFIAKPFDLEGLLLRVRVWLARAPLTPVMTNTLKVYTLGPFRAFLGDALLCDETTGDARIRLILKYLVTFPDEPVERGRLLYLIWPDLDEVTASRQLDALLEHLHGLLNADLPDHDYIVRSGNAFRLNTAADYWCDADDFENQVRAAQDAQESGDSELAYTLFLSALALYKEDYLRENLYDDWPSDRRERLRELWISAMFRTAAICADRCEFADSIRLMKKVLDVDPYRENAYQAVMLYLSRGGRRSEAIQLYRYAERLFAQHLAAQPAPSTRMLYEKILRGETS